MGLGCKPMGKYKRLIKRLENDMAKIEALDKAQKETLKTEKKAKKEKNKE